jgi:uncharacterized Rmd1/YagE family protein
MRSPTLAPRSILRLSRCDAQAGYKRITAYCIARSFKTKLLASFLKREHNVSPRIFDEALYAVRPRLLYLLSI